MGNPETGTGAGGLPKVTSQLRVGAWPRPTHTPQEGGGAASNGAGQVAASHGLPGGHFRVWGTT